MKYFPFFFDLERKSILIVGGGEEALSKARLLCKTEALITLVAPRILPELSELIKTNKGQIFYRPFREEDLSEHSFVICATRDKTLHDKIYHLAQTKKIPVNCVDRQENCNFIFPAIVDRSPFVIAIGSEGAAPVLATYWRNRLEVLIPKRLSVFVLFLQKWRTKIKENIGNIVERRQFYLDLIQQGTICHDVDQGRFKRADQSMAELLSAKYGQEQIQGKVFLIGAGPGDPELLTIKAVNLLSRADIVFYDCLISEQALDYCRRDARLICVGKRSGNHPIPQAKINEMMLKSAQEGKTVIRLKGGDPLIYGRGGEEALFLKSYGIDVEIVPGITAVLGAAAATGVPLTFRGVSNKIGIHTIYDKSLQKSLDTISQDTSQTLVFYMSTKNLLPICRKLLEKRFEAKTPILVVENATLTNQKVYRAVISRPEPILFCLNSDAPSIVIIGKCVDYSFCAAQESVQKIIK